jgi:hypothetical protein
MSADKGLHDMARQRFGSAPNQPTTHLEPGYFPTPPHASPQSIPIITMGPGTGAPGMENVSPKHIIRFETAKLHAEKHKPSRHQDVHDSEEAEDLAEVESSVSRSAMLLRSSLKRAA